MRDAVIVDAVRTPIGKGKPTGSLSPVHPVDLLAHTLRALAERTAIDPALIDDVIGGCVDQVGEQAANTTRWAVLAAGFPETVPATTVDRQCRSSQQAVHFPAQGIRARAPLLLPRRPSAAARVRTRGGTGRGRSTRQTSRPRAPCRGRRGDPPRALRPPRAPHPPPAAGPAPARCMPPPPPPPATSKVL